MRRPSSNGTAVPAVYAAMRKGLRLGRFMSFAPAAALLAGCGAIALGLAAYARQHWWAKMPWGLTNIWWDLPSMPTPFRSISITVEIAGELPPDARLYIAPFGNGWLNGAGFYAGLILGARLPDGSRGRIGIFSRWNERSLAAVRTMPDGYSESGGYEGDFISVRRPFAWAQGRYRLTLELVRQDGMTGGSWVGYSIEDLASGRREAIGALRFPGAPLGLKPSIASFVELFERPIRPRAIPSLRIRFGDLRINDRPVRAHRRTARYKAVIPPYAKAWPGAEGSVHVETGRRFRRAGLRLQAEHYAERLGD